MPKLLITNNQLYSYGGSEMVTLEIVEEFLLRGWKVDVYTNFLDDPFQSEFDRLYRTTELTMRDDGSELVATDYDLIWVNQSVLPESIISKLTQLSEPPPLVWHHMSSFLDIESPVLADIEVAVASRILTISEEAKEMLVRYGIPAERIDIFPNPVPRTFLEPQTRKLPERPRCVLAISNHYPPELEEAFELIEAQGVTVDRIGTRSPRRVTPSAFDQADAVITIAKSTQYALCMGIPSFEYDINGGCGWITQENFEAEYATNFSGRTLGRKITAEQIAEEFLGDYMMAREYAEASVEKHRTEFSLPQFINDLLKRLDSEPNQTRLLLRYGERWSSYARLQRNFYRSVTFANRELQALQTSLEPMKELVAQLEDERLKLSIANQEIRRSYSYRIGDALLTPLRWLRPKRNR